jgi:transcriptional regulator with XRE-family HTH domain
MRVNFRQFRKQKNLTQKRLIELTGLSPATISAIERGIANPSMETVNKLAKVFCCTPAELFEVISPASLAADDRV